MDKEEKNTTETDKTREQGNTGSTGTGMGQEKKDKRKGQTRNFILLIALLFLSCLVAGLAIRSGTKPGVSGTAEEATDTEDTETAESTEATEGTETGEETETSEEPAFSEDRPPVVDIPEIPDTAEGIAALDEQIFAKNETHPELLSYSGVDTSACVPYGDYELGGLFICDTSTWDQYFVYADCTLSQALACVIQSPVTELVDLGLTEGTTIHDYRIDMEDGTGCYISYDETDGTVFDFSCGFGYVTFMDTEEADMYIANFLSDDATGEGCGCGCGGDADDTDSTDDTSCDTGTGCSSTDDMEDSSSCSSMDGMDSADSADSMDINDQLPCGR